MIDELYNVLFATKDQTAAPSTGVGRTTSSSFKDPVMALPGQSLHENARAQHHGRIAEYIIVAAFTAIMASFEWVRSWIALPPQPVAVSFLAAGLIVYASVRIYLLTRKLKALNAERDGRKRLQEHVQQLGDRGYYAFDGIIDGYGMSIGSVLVGPGGLFVLEVKTYTQSGSPRDRIEQPTPETLFIGGRPAIGNPLRQARNSARRLAMTLESQGAAGYNPLALLVFPGWRIGKAHEKGDVRVINETMLADYLKSRPNVLEARDVIVLCEALDACRAASPGHR
ncbi:MAG: hypothetical protein ACI9R3_004501 [Verrucomicrobiales bacterium]